MTEKKVVIPFGAELYQARFIERPNKFLVRCLLDDPRLAMLENSVIEAHLPDPGRLQELLIPGCLIWLREALGQKRKTKWSVVVCQVPNKEELVSLDTTLPNRLVGKALTEGALAELAGWSLVKAEYTQGHSRWDFLLANAVGDRLFLEVKSVTLVEDRVGLFPDAITARGAKHLRELAAISCENGTQAAILFLAQRADVDIIRPAAAIDPQFAAELVRAAEAGVQILGRKCLVNTVEIALGEQVPVDVERSPNNVQF